MMDELERVTQDYLVKRKELDQLEREHALLKARAYLTVYREYSNAEARDAAATVIMEEEHASALDKIQNLRGEVRELAITREILLIKVRGFSLYESDKNDSKK